MIPKRQHMKVVMLLSVKWMFLAEMQTFSLHVKHWSAMRVTWSLGRSHETFSWELSSVAFKYSSLSQAVLLTLTSSECWCSLATVAISKNQFLTVQQKQSPLSTGSGRVTCINFGALVTWKEKRKKALTGSRGTIQSSLLPWRRLEKLIFTGDGRKSEN